MWKRLYLGARSLGISAEQFWSSSPRELSWEAEAARERIARSISRTRETAWLTAYLSRVKRMPELARLLGGTEKPAEAPKRQTWQEMKAALKAITGHG